MIDNEKVEITNVTDEELIRESLHPSHLRIKRLVVLADNNTVGDDQVSIDSFKKYFLPRVKIENYNTEINGRNF